ncbi:hypothetical protein PM082_024292 [Marasmius tenuissimus]|nr:hypothetical protein PM082_024292 [Marasmius tenuissimus]
MWSRSDEDVELYDPFEPNNIRPALEMVNYNLGHLIFGTEKWVELGGTVPPPGKFDPVTQFFTEIDIFNNAETYLRSDAYSTLYINTTGQSNRSHREPFLYRSSSVKQVWSIVPNFPWNCWNSIPTAGDPRPANGGRELAPLNLLVGKDKEALTFSSIVNQKTSDVAIGPLKYCGNALSLVYGQKKIVSPCFDDPTLDDSIIERHVRGQAHNKARVVPGVAMSKKHIAKTQKLVHACLNNPHHIAHHDTGLASTSSPLKPVERRLSADKKLALDSRDDGIEEITGRKRRRLH